MEKTAAQKMGIKSRDRVLFVDEPEGIVNYIGLPDVEITENLIGYFDVILFFVEEQSLLKEKFPLLKQHLKPDGMLWISWPKAGQLETNLEIKKIIRIGYEFGLVESKAISIDSVWSAIKFTFPKAGKRYENSYGDLKLDK